MPNSTDFDAGPAKSGATSLLFIVTDPMTVQILMADQLEFLGSAGLRVGVATAPGAARIPGVDLFPIASLVRQYSPLRDLASLFRLMTVIRRFRPDIVNASTPKAGLLGMLAARATRVPTRIYTLRGLRLETTRGLARRILTLTEKLAAGSANRVVCVSQSLRRATIELALATEEKTTVLGHGSSNGVDVERFRPALSSNETSSLRERLRIPAEAPVVGFVGRLTKDKGVDDLCEAFVDAVAGRHPEAWLLMVGDFERGDPVAANTVARLGANPRVVRTGFVEDVAPYYRIMDVLVLPSYREGFPNAPLEAAASGLPVVGYRVTGTVDAVEDGVTGTLVEAGDRAALGASVCHYLAEPDLARQHGGAGRRRVEQHFRQERVWQDWLDEYHRLVATTKRAAGPSRVG